MQNVPQTLINGCEVPAHLMNSKLLPVPPYLKNKPSYQDQIQWDNLYIETLQNGYVDLINDRIELNKICKG